MKIKVVIADDQEIVREGLKAMLHEEPWIEVVGEAGDGEEVLSFLERYDADLVLLDIGMPRMDGIACSANIRKYWPQTQILIISMHQSEQYVIDAFRAGANGYISKDSCKTEIVSAIRALADGNSYFTKDVSQKLWNHLNRPPQDRKAASGFSGEPVLTPREAEVLELIADEYTNQEIADRLFISPHTVVTHRRNLLQKLNAKNTAGLVHQASRYGLLH